MGMQSGGGRPGYTVDGRHERTSSATGVDAWLPEPMPPAPKAIEYRMQVRPGALLLNQMSSGAPLGAGTLLMSNVTPRFVSVPDVG